MSSKKGWVKWLAFLLPVIGGTMQLLQMVVDDQNTKEAVKEEVAKQLAEKVEENEEEAE